MKATVSIRINYRDWKYLRTIFPAEKDETIAKYMERYIKELKGGKSEK